MASITLYFKTSTLRIRTALFCMCIGFMFSASSNAQEADILQYLDEGGIPAPQTIMFEVTQLAQSNFQFLYEHAFGEYLSVKVGLGYLTYKMYSPAFRPLWSDPMGPDLKNGFSFSISPLFYPLGYTSIYGGPNFHYRRVPNMARSSQISFIFGKRWMISDRLSLAGDAGLGLRFEKSLDNIHYFNGEDATDARGFGYEEYLCLPISIRVGWLLN